MKENSIGNDIFFVGLDGKEKERWGKIIFSTAKTNVLAK